MPSAIHTETTVLPGHRIEISDPALPEGATVHVEVTLSPNPPQTRSMLEFLDSLPPGPGPRAFSTWEEYEEHLKEEKNSWHS